MTYMAAPEASVSSVPSGGCRRPVPMPLPAFVQSDAGPSPSSTERGSKVSEEEGVADAQPLSSRGVEEHRVDPALRAALERLDAVRKKQPSMEEFNLERYMGRPPSADSVQEPSAEVRPQRTSVAAAVDRGLLPCFSTDLLLAAVRQPAQRRGPNLPPSGVGSRSTSPGSTLESSTSGSIGGLSNSSGALGDTPPARLGGPVRGSRPPMRPPRGYEVPRPEPVTPPGAPPRRPGRRNRRAEESAR
mmetsp:Transcript_42495/g.95369  ORF Transcript_42495/g.95369 Transcript_42495/m.95369 type:complete len:245 (+) Transcript_42495:60-794(+)